MLGITGGLGTIYNGRALPVAVIDDYIMPMVAEAVRDQIALIVSTELVNLKAKAEDLAVNSPGTLQGIQAQADLDNGIYDIISNIYIEKGSDFTDEQMPGLNIFYGRSDFAANQGNSINIQRSLSTYTIEVHLREKHKQSGNDISYADEKSAKNAMRIVGILRGIIMSGQYITLGDAFQGIVWGRRVASVDIFQPDFQNPDSRHGIIGVVSINVDFKEVSPELQGVELLGTLTEITSKLRTADDGKVLTIET